MTTSMTRLRIGCVLCALSAASCALTSRSEPMRVRYFALDEGSSRVPASAQPAQLELKLGRVEATDRIGAELAVRTSRHELEYREDQRWTEKPDEYLRRALERALFQEQGIGRAYSGLVPTLDVELIAFEEVSGSTPKARLRAAARLHDERRGLCEETLTVERPIAAHARADHTEQTVAALSEALNGAVEQLAQRVVGCLNQARANEARARAESGEAPATARISQP